MQTKSISICTLLIWFACAFTSVGAQQPDGSTPLSAALRISSLIDRDSYAFDEGRRQIIRAYLQNKNFEQAFELARDTNTNERIELLSYIAGQAVRAHNAGRQGGAGQTREDRHRTGQDLRVQGSLSRT